MLLGTVFAGRRRISANDGLALGSSVPSRESHLSGFVLPVFDETPRKLQKLQEQTSLPRRRRRDLESSGSPWVPRSSMFAPTGRTWRHIDVAPNANHLCAIEDCFCFESFSWSSLILGNITRVCKEETSIWRRLSGFEQSLATTPTPLFLSHFSMCELR